MTMPISQLIQKSMLRALTLGLLSSLIIATPLLAAEKPAHHAAHDAPAPATLVQAVRNGTRQYINVNNATAAGYGSFLGCVAGTDHGAMGIHYVNGTLLANLTLDPAQPQALIYEPDNGKMTLVGVEFILDSATWLAANNNTPPVLDGQVFNFVGAPNRFNIPSFFELHVWAWRDNPQGSFVDWNNVVTCDNQ
jgi:energy-converting hydrogenase Eha subunit A